MNQEVKEHYLVMVVVPVSQSADVECFNTMKECRDYAHDKYGDDVQYIIARVVESRNIPVAKGPLN